MLTLYDYLPSQNAYKIRLLLNHLQRPYRTRLISIFEGEGQSAEYLAISPTGTVPAIVLENGFRLAESNAILVFLAAGSAYLPEDAQIRAKVLQWLFFEAETVQGGVATLRHWVQTGKDKNRPPELLEAKRNLSLKALAILDRELAANDFLGGRHYSVADMAVFAYVHLADEAGLPLKDYRHVVDWIARVRAQDGFLAEMHPYAIDPHSAGEL